jgi:hypothetical protein
LGLTGYHRRFIKDYSTITTPLTHLLRKDGFAWGPNVEAVFRELQRALTTTPILQLPDFDRPFVVECDASGAGVGAVLHQGAGPIAFFSHQLTPCHTNLATYERELIGLVQAVRALLVEHTVLDLHRPLQLKILAGSEAFDDSAAPVGK